MASYSTARRVRRKRTDRPDKAYSEFRCSRMVPAGLNATIGWALGLPINEKVTASSGQQFHIANDGKPITGLFA